MECGKVKKVILILDNGKRVNRKDMAYTHGIMVINIKDNFPMDWSMAMELIYFTMEILILDNSSMGNHTDTDNIHGKMVQDL